MTLHLLSIVLPVFGFIVLGFLASKIGIATEQMQRGLSDFLFMFAIPALLFHTLSTSAFPSNIPWGYWVSYFTGVGVCWLLSMVIADKIWRTSPQETIVAGLATGQANLVMIGIPIILQTYGPTAGVPIALLIAVNLPVTMMIAIFLMEGATEEKVGHKIRRQLKKLASHPVLLGIGAGLCAHVAGIKPSGMVEKMIHDISSMAVPGSLCVVGMSLAHYGFKGNVLHSLVTSFIKLGLHPLIVYLLAHHLFALPPLWVGAAVLFAAAPVGINVYLFAARYRQGLTLASTSIALSTVLSFFTTFFWLWILGIPIK